MLEGLRPTGILGTGIYLPEKRLTNFDLEKIVDTSDTWIRERSGIVERRIASEEEATSDMCYYAAREAIDNAGISPEQIDLIIIATVTPDMAFPATGCIVQEKLGAAKAAAFDLEAGCTGFIYALSIAVHMIGARTYDYVLIVGAETFSRIINWKDRGSCVLFGDGAGAAVVGPVPDGYGFLSICLGAEGEGGKFLYQPAGGSRLPASQETVARNLHTIHMHGREVFKFAVRVMGDTALETLKRAGLSKKDVDFLIPHQANIRIIDAALRRLGLPSSKVYINLDRYGNISSASIPIALHEALGENKIKIGDTVLLVAFGAGLTYGGAVLKWWQPNPNR